MKNHPVYTALQAEGSYATPAMAARLARTALKKAFPKTKFSVSSGQSRLSINWTDGPTQDLVDAIVDVLSGKGFDGSIDMAYYKSTFVNPDGTFSRGGSQGTVGSMGYATEFENDKPAEAIKASFGCYVFTNRDYSEATLHRTLKHYAAKYDNPVTDAILDGIIYVKKQSWGGVYIEGTMRLFGGYDANRELSRYRAKRMVAA